MKQFSKIIVTTLFIAFLASCSKDKDASPSSASVVGKWTFSAIGIKTDTKTTEATLAEIKKLDEDAGTTLESVIEFKADGTYLTTGEDSETGKYTVDSGNKNITTTSSVAEVTTFEIVSLSNSEMVLGQFKSSKKDAAGDFEFEDDLAGLFVYIFADAIYTIRGIDGEADFEKAKSVQLILKFKK